MTPKAVHFVALLLSLSALWWALCRSDASSRPLMIAVPTATPIPAGKTLFSLGPGYAAMWVPTEFAEEIVDVIT